MFSTLYDYTDTFKNQLLHEYVHVYSHCLCGLLRAMTWADVIIVVYFQLRRGDWLPASGISGTSAAAQFRGERRPSAYTASSCVFEFKLLSIVQVLGIDTYGGSLIAVDSKTFASVQNITGHTGARTQDIRVISTTL